MAGQTFTRAEFFALLEQEGEETVRTKVLLKHYGAGNGKLELAKEWVRLKDQEREDASKRRHEASNLEHISIARSAKNAAWAAAMAAIVAAIFAAVAIVISLLDLPVSRPSALSSETSTSEALQP